MDKIRQNWPSAVIIIIYIVGLIGFMIPGMRDQFGSMSWANLLLSFVLLLFCEKKVTTPYWISLLIIGASGYFLEVIGVQTGVLFGQYTYGDSLGLKAFDVPLMIGVNWIMLVYVFNYIARKFFSNGLMIITTASMMMVGLDFLIEPFAIRFDLWSWAAVHVPVQNYIMWFLISFGMNYLFLKMNPRIDNPLAIPLGVCMIIFFFTIDLLVIWT